MHAFGVPRSQPLRVLIDQEIMDVIIGDMTFYPEDMEGVSRTCLLARFVSTLDFFRESRCQEGQSGCDQYQQFQAVPFDCAVLGCRTFISPGEYGCHK